MFAKGIKWNWTAAVSFLILHAHIMKLRKGNHGGRGSLERLSFSPSWLCRFGLFALERVSVSVFHSSWGNLLKELFCEITLCKTALCVRGREGSSQIDSGTSGGSETTSQEWMVTAWPAELFCYQPPRYTSSAWMGVLPGAQVLEFAQARSDLLHICHIHVILERVFASQLSVDFTLCHLQACTELTRM